MVSSVWTWKQKEEGKRLSRVAPWRRPCAHSPQLEAKNPNVSATITNVTASSIAGRSTRTWLARVSTRNVTFNTFYQASVEQRMFKWSAQNSAPPGFKLSWTPANAATRVDKLCFSRGGVQVGCCRTSQEENHIQGHLNTEGHLVGTLARFGIQLQPFKSKPCSILTMTSCSTLC